MLDENDLANASKLTFKVASYVFNFMLWTIHDYDEF